MVEKNPLFYGQLAVTFGFRINELCFNHLFEGVNDLTSTARLATVHSSPRLAYAGVHTPVHTLLDLVANSGFFLTTKSAS
jgi:hypothetical protein